MAGLQGKVFSGYQLAEQVNGGGIAEVYRARPAQPGGREAIVKVIYPEFAQQKGFLPHFREIVKLSKRLASHPHILPLLASGEENGYLYLITPYVAAGTLKDWIASGRRLSASDTGPFFHQLCDALGYAHSLGIIHGNIKPSNIFLFEGRHVLLGDFGMLWDIGMLREFAQMDASHSAEAVEYLAPEVAHSSATQLSDIYSVGAVLFAAITGQPPFRSSTLGEALAAHERKPAPHLQQINASLAPAMLALDSVTQRALAKRPEDRFPAAAALSQAIEVVLKQAQAQAAAAVAQTPQMSQALQAQQIAAAWMQNGAGAAAVPGVFGAVPPSLPGMAGMAGVAGGMAGMAGFPAAAATAGAGAVLQTLNPPFPPLPPSATVDETMEHGRVNLNQPVEAPTARVPAPQPPAKNAPDLQQTMRVPAPEPPPAPTMRIPAPQVAVGRENGTAWNNANAGAMPAANPASFPGYQQQQHGGPGNSGDLHPQSMPAVRGMGNMGAVSPSVPGAGYAPSGDGINWSTEDDDGAAWDDLNSRRYASVRPDDSQRLGGGYGSRGTEEPWPEYTSESAAYPAVDETGRYQAPARDDWREEYTGEFTGEYTGEFTGEFTGEYTGHYTGEFTGEYTGRGYAVGDDSRELESWTSQERTQNERADGRDFSPTELGLPRLTSPALSAELPPAWQDIVGGTLPPDARGQQGWGGTLDYKEAMPHNAPVLRMPQPPDRFAGAGVAPFAEPLAEPQVAVANKAAVKRKGKWIRRLVPIILVLVLLDLGIIAVARPDLCPSNSCQAISTKAHQLLPFLKGANAPAAPVLSSDPAAITLTVAESKSATTTLKLTNAGPGTATWKAESGFPWFTLDTASGTLKANASITLTLTATPTNMHPGPYTAAITVTSGGQVLTIPVTITVTAS